MKRLAGRSRARTGGITAAGKRWIRGLRSLISPSSLRFQLLSRSLFLLAALLILIGVFQYVIMKDFLYKNQAETMVSQMRGPLRDVFMKAGQPIEHWGPPKPGGDGAGVGAEAGMNGSAPGGGGIGGEGTDGRPPQLFIPGASLAIINSDHDFIDLNAESGAPAPQLSDAEYAALFEESQPGSEGYRVIEDQDGKEQLVVFRLVGLPGEQGERAWLVQMGTYTAPLREVVMRQLLTFVGLSLLALAGGLALYLPILRQALTPLNQMVRIVEDTNAGNLSNRFTAASGQSEIDRLGASFNGMLERLEESFEAEREAKEQMRRFVADASHELRTPLTSIHGFLEVLLRGAANRPEQLHTALNSMLGEAQRMKKLVEDLLTLAKLDRTPVVQRTQVRLDKVIAEMEPHLRMLAGEREVLFDLQPGLTAMCDRDKIKQVVLNLFHNAVQHTDPQQGTIAVRLSAHPRQAELDVRDNGPGIAPEHLPHVFERFYRIDASRTRKQGGAGLGLSISQAIVEAHGGTIEVHSEPGQGATFRVTLPAI
ncbi:ATP-binding protein [Paenibacillus phoenicis]|uniref:histidine kinase n=1 Tax=Paenibacillus phoenicis TaxID=554117 RepID=A0ABU5PN86_9BACL|nr:MULTISPECIES: HAMP domain-containing sensor histidine kinase [Paenibacillus]MCT2197507.1 HAMP domain-containing histidine kinase [Paenibacillus sp. p3-SID1389]MEA3571129.1 ATP-binding protein [Paenibacillus phoenicis]